MNLKKRKIFFVSYGGGHINIIDLIAKELINNPHVEFKILALTTAYDKIINKYPTGIVKRVSDYSFLFEDIIDDVLKYGDLIIKDNYNPDSNVSKKETLFYLGLSYYDLVNERGRNEANKLYNKKKRQAFLPVKTLEKILLYEKADIVVATTSPRFEHASLIAGNNLNLITVEILDLFSHIYPIPVAKNLVVMNQGVKAGLISQGLINNNFHVFGQPAVENTVKKIKELDRQLLFIKNNLNSSKLTLLLATQVFISVNKENEVVNFNEYHLTYNYLFPMLEELSDKYDLNVLVRLHPNENYNDYLDYFEKYKFLKYSNDILNLEESLCVSDIVLVESSTVALEAIACGKKVFTYKQDIEHYYSMPAFKELPFIYSSNLSNLKKNLIAYLKDKDNNENMEEFMPKNSVRKIVELLTKTL
ncbi:hypothetical protein [Polaribacter uvawellassae]|uniref:hypothetical protein n=1 Tax=Polaribacter uvawellassae TaxID=3133495 RepID=UPI00321B8A43